MKEFQRKYFCNPRPLPLDRDGRVDFSLDQWGNQDEPIIAVDPLRDERFMGRLFNSVSMSDGERVIILIRWDDTDRDLSLQITNYNVFRIDSQNNIIWQVRREEDGFVNWESRNLHAKENDPTCEGYLDPFLAMSEKFFVREEVLSKGPFHPKFKEVYFDEYRPGRLLWLITGRWAYDLDPETGIATCTGEQVK